MNKRYFRLSIKSISILLTVFLMVFSISACGTRDTESKAESEFKIVTTIFPVYDWIMNVLGDNPSNIEVSLLIDNGIDMHSYQPSVDDILSISSCDLFIYVGGESDQWAEDVIADPVNKDLRSINLLETLGDIAKAEELKEGMTAEAEESQGEESEENQDEMDEHVWLSIKNAELFVKKISESIIEIDEKQAPTYKENTANYLEKLESLDQEYENIISSSGGKTLLFCDRFPFRYLIDDYGLDYYAAFPGCSAETEASFETIRFLANKADDLRLKRIIILEGSDNKLANAIIQARVNGDTEILSLNSMQSLTTEDYGNGISYLSVMEDNLEVIKKALN